MLAREVERLARLHAAGKPLPYLYSAAYRKDIERGKALLVDENCSVYPVEFPCPVTGMDRISTGADRRDAERADDTWRHDGRSRL